VRFGCKRRRHLGGGAALLVILLASLGPAAPASPAAGPPVISEVWASQVASSTARLNARIDPNGLATAYHLDYLPKATYDANVVAGKDPFTGALRAPPVFDGNVGSGTGAVHVSNQISLLTADTAYRYRFVASNSSSPTPVVSGAFTVVTRPISDGTVLPDGRGWEMVSPVDKNGGQVDRPGDLADGGSPQAAADGQSVTYGSATSFGAGAQGAAIASQYLATRTADGWSTQNLTAPLYSSSYAEDEGTPFQLFSTDLARALLLNGRHCRGEGVGCPVPNPPLAGTDAPVGYQNYYLREGGGYVALLTSADAGFLSLDPADFELRLAGASPDLRHVVLSTCAALTADATEVPLGGGCDPGQANLYAYALGAGLRLVNLLPAQSQGTPGAELAAQSEAVSADGSRIYFTQGGNLYLREGIQTKQVDVGAGGGGTFQTASADGSVAYFSKSGHLWRYLAAGAGTAADLTPAGGVEGVLGTSQSGARVYYLTAAGLFVWHGGSATKVADGADASNYPPATGTSRISADGTKLLFVSTAPLTGYDNTDETTGSPDSQVYLYDASGGGSLACVSCNPTFARPIGPSSISGAIANGSTPSSIRMYKPRALAADGRRVFFDSEDAIAQTDTNREPDVYQWEAEGSGTCTRAGGCVSLISSGRSTAGASFVDASADGSDAFFLTDGSLVPADSGAVDLYDARVGGGFPAPPPLIACLGDACQPLPSEPVDPTLTTLLPGPGNPAVRYPKSKSKGCKKGKVKRKGFCVKKKGKNKEKNAKRGGKR
jgi:hypothetical protein